MPKKIEFGSVSVKFVLDNLSSKQLDEMDANPPALSEVVGWLGEMIEGGYRFSCVWDATSGSVQVTMVAAFDNAPSPELAISSRSSSLDDCFLILYWKYVQVAKGDLSRVDVHGSMRG